MVIPSKANGVTEMAYKIADRNAELLYQTGDREFRMRLDNGVEVNVDVDSITLVADVDLIERIQGDIIYCTAIAIDIMESANA